MSVKLAKVSYVDEEVKGIVDEIYSTVDLENVISKSNRKQVLVVLKQAIDFNGCTLPAYTMIFIPCARSGTDTIGFATNISTDAFYVIGKSWTNSIWKAKKIY